MEVYFLTFEHSELECVVHPQVMHGVYKGWLLFSGLDYWTDIFLVFTHVAVSLIDYHW